jgi:hypothetical protein
MLNPSDIVEQYNKFLVEEFEKYLIEQYGSDFLELGKVGKVGKIIKIGVSKENLLYTRNNKNYKFMDFYDEIYKMNFGDRNNLATINNLDLSHSNKMYDLIKILNETTQYNAELHEIPIFNKIKFNDNIFDQKTGKLIKTETKYVINEKSLARIDIVLFLSIKPDLPIEL